MLLRYQKNENNKQIAYYKHNHAISTVRWPDKTQRTCRDQPGVCFVLTFLASFFLSSNLGFKPNIIKDNFGAMNSA